MKKILCSIVGAMLLGACSKGNDLIDIGTAPKFELTNQNNEKISSADNYKGKVYVLEFFFSSCPSICVVMNNNMLKLQGTFKNENDFAIASITINPEEDTPEVLKAHGNEIGVSMNNWHLLTGDKNYIFSIANKFKLEAKENNEAIGGFEHSGLFALIDKNGNIRCRAGLKNTPYYDGLDSKEVDFLKEDIAILLKD